jgi:hypothetical protein
MTIKCYFVKKLKKNIEKIIIDFEFAKDIRKISELIATLL